VWNCLISFLSEYLKFVAFCPKFSGDSYLKFRERTISGEFFRNFVQTKAILYRNLWNFALLSAILFLVRIALKKFTQVLSYLVFSQVRRQVHRKITNRRYGEEKPGRFVFGKPISFTLGMGLTTPYSLGILVWNFYRTLIIVSTEFWAPNSSHRICKKKIYSSLPRLEGRFVCVWNCLISFLGEYSSVGPEICRVFSQIQWGFFPGILGKNYFGRIFQKFCANQGYPKPKLVKFRHTFCNFNLGPYCVEKIHACTFICCLHLGKEAGPYKNHKKKIQGEKARTFCFRKTGFVHSRSRNYYTLLLGYFGLKFLPDTRHCVY